MFVCLKRVIQKFLQYVKNIFCLFRLVLYEKDDIGRLNAIGKH